MTAHQKMNALGQSSQHVNLHINNVETAMIIDSGSSVSVLDFKAFLQLRKHCKIKLSETKSRIFQNNTSKPLPVKGSFRASTYSDDSKVKTDVEFIVIDTPTSGSLLGKDTALKLDLLRIGPSTGLQVNSATIKATSGVLLSHNF